MTIVVGFSDTVEAIVIADSRLGTYDQYGDLRVQRDICQKLVAANAWSVVGFAGDLCLASFLIFALSAHGAKWLNPIFLRLTSRLMGLLLAAIAMQFLINALTDLKLVTLPGETLR